MFKPSVSVIQTSLSPANENLQFREGGSIYDISSFLELPGDDATAMLNFFRIIHFRSEGVKITCSCLAQLAVVCDKYCCATRLRDFFVLVTRKPGMNVVPYNQKSLCTIS